ncbi:MAG TPA: DMT family transporter [Solirubrobacterales bacterium]|nr:DMT family transporter [Solirubrobacterales bacterium]
MSVAAGVVVIILVGVLGAPQAPLNRGLAAVTGPLASACTNFLVGLALVLAVCTVAGKLGGVWDVWGVPPEQTLGGLLGAIYVLSALTGVGSIGASGVTAATVAGQMTASLALDATGALGLEQRSLTIVVVLGALAVFAGTYLVVAGRNQGFAKPAGGPHRLLAAALVVVGGLAIGVQHPLNGQLGSQIGDLPAAVVSFVLGSLALLAILTARGEVGRLAGVVRVPWRYRLGGAIGAVIVTASLALVDTIGAGALAAATVTGLAIASLALDRAGALGLQRRALTPRRLAGALLVVGGTALVARS